MCDPWNQPPWGHSPREQRPQRKHPLYWDCCVWPFAPAAVVPMVNKNQTNAAQAAATITVSAVVTVLRGKAPCDHKGNMLSTNPNLSSSVLFSLLRISSAVWWPGRKVSRKTDLQETWSIVKRCMRHMGMYYWSNWYLWVSVFISSYLCSITATPCLPHWSLLPHCEPAVITEARQWILH